MSRSATHALSKLRELRVNAWLIVVMSLVVVPLVCFPIPRYTALLKESSFKILCVWLLFSILAWAISRTVFPRASIWWLGLVAWWLALALSAVSAVSFVTLKHEVLWQACYTLFAIGIVILLGSAEMRLMAIRTAVAVSTIICIYGFIQIAGLDPLPWPETVTERLTSTLSQATLTSAWLAYWLPAAIALYFVEVGRLNKLLCLIAISIILLGIIFTGSRGSWAASFASLSLFFALCPQTLSIKGVRTVRMTALLLLAMTIGLTVSTIIQIGSLPTNNRLKDDTPMVHTKADQVRKLAWESAFAAGRERPVFGWGPSSYPYIEGKFLKPDFYRIESNRAGNAHNEFLQIFAEMGAVGVLAFVALTTISLYILLKPPVIDGKDRLLALSTGVALIGLMISNLGGVSLRQVTGGITFWLAIGLAGTYGDAIRLRMSGVLERTKTAIGVAGIIAIFASIALTVSVYSQLVAARFAHNAFDAMTAEDYQKAEYFWRKCTRIEPAEEQNWWGLAVTLQQEGDDEAAIAAYRSILKISPYSVRAYRRIGAIQLRTMQFSQAEQTYRRTLAIQTSPDDLMGLAESLVRQNRLNDAEPLFSKILIADPPTVARWFPQRVEPQEIVAATEALTADRMAQWGYPQRAKTHWMRALALQPGNGRFWRSYGALRLEQGDFSSAQHALSKAAKLLPGDSETIANQAALANYKGDKPLAIRLYQKALAARNSPDLEAWIAQRLKELTDSQ